MTPHIPTALAVLCFTVFALAQQAGIVRFRAASIMDDPRRIGGEAYRLLVPADWRVESNVMWHNSAANTASPWIKLIGPSKQEIGVLPAISFIWNPNLIGAKYKPGSFYSGSEIQFPALDPFQCVEKIVIPRYRRHLDNASIVKRELLPELAAAGLLKYPQQQYPNAVFQAGKVRFEYAENGVNMEEDVYVLTVAVQFPSGQTVTTAWSPDEIRYSKAPKGTLDSQLPLFQTCLFSLRPNLKWWGHLQQLSQEYGRLQAQAPSSAAARVIEQGAIAADRMEAPNRSTEQTDQTDALNLKRYEHRQAVMDSLNLRWEGTRQVELYRNSSTGENVALPSGYNSGWVSASGEYLVTASSDFDPNSAGGPWRRLEKAAP